MATEGGGGSSEAGGEGGGIEGSGEEKVRGREGGR